MIFKQCIETCIFPSSWKKGNIVLIHKNGDKQTLKKLFSSVVVTYLWKNSWLDSSNQPCFKPGNSCINQLLSITQEVYGCFNMGLEVRSIFHDISRAFNMAWHDGAIHKLNQNGISGNLLNL